jgi:hypothetical protein
MLKSLITRLFGHQELGKLVIQPPDEIFNWPKGVVLTALDEVTLSLPVALVETLSEDQPLKSVIHGHDDMRIYIPRAHGDTNDNAIYMYLKPGMSLSFSVPIQAYVVSKDKTPKRFRIEKT